METPDILKELAELENLARSNTSEGFSALTEEANKMPAEILAIMKSEPYDLMLQFTLFHDDLSGASALLKGRNVPFRYIFEELDFLQEFITKKGKVKSQEKIDFSNYSLPIQTFVLLSSGVRFAQITSEVLRMIRSSGYYQTIYKRIFNHECQFAMSLIVFQDIVINTTLRHIGKEMKREERTGLQLFSNSCLMTRHFKLRAYKKY